MTFGCTFLAWLTIAVGVDSSTCVAVQGKAVALAAFGPPEVEHIWLEHLYTPRRGIPRLTATSAKQVYATAHELGHIRTWRSVQGAELDAVERAADRWAQANYCAVVKKLGRGQRACWRLWGLLPREWKHMARGFGAPGELHGLT